MTRQELIRYLYSLSHQEMTFLEQLMKLQGMPNGNFAGYGSPVGQRAIAILTWWDSPLCSMTTNQLLELKLDAEDMAAIYNLLVCIPDPQLGQIVFTINPPPDLMPASSASGSEKVNALVMWAYESDQLSELNAIFKEVIKR